MRKSAMGLLVLMVVGVLNMGQEQCSPEFPLPPFDATGDYAGIWRGRSDDQMQIVEACPLSITLAQDTSLNWPEDHAVKGQVVIDYSCIELPEWVQPIPPSVVDVGGLLGDDGHLVLLSGGCGTGLCVVLALDGEGEDEDADGLMDRYEGEWSFVILLAGVEPFGVAGFFDVEGVD
jgi:hypothetical protein